MKYIVGLVLFIFILSFIGLQSKPDYRKIHKNAIIIDTHNDLVGRIMDGEDLSVRTNHGHSDLPRFIEGGVDAQVFSIFVSPSKSPKDYYSIANSQIDSVESFVKHTSGKAEIAKSADEIRNLNSEGKFVVMLGIEGGHAIQDDIQNLEHFYKRGVRYMTLTWNNSTSWAISATDEEANKSKSGKNGLSALGIKVVQKMNRLGMIVDVSHLGEKAFWDVIKSTTKPVIASHSSVWAICPNRRNLKDDQIKAIAKTGGAVFINFAPFFIDSTFVSAEKEIRLKNKSVIDSIKSLKIKNADELIDSLLRKSYSEIKPDISKLVDHIDYIVKLVGIDYVGLGSDYDGISVAPLGLEDVTCYPNITKELVGRGYKEANIKKILGENFIRILKQNEDNTNKSFSY